MSKPSPTLNLILVSVRKASRHLARDFGEIEHLQLAKKSPVEFAMAAKRKSGDVLYRELSQGRPGYGFQIQGREPIEGTDPTHIFYIDPLNTVDNFLHGIPHFALSVALQREGELVAGLIYDLCRDEIFSAEKGRGAWLNATGRNQRLRVSARQHLREAILVTGPTAPESAQDKAEMPENPFDIPGPILRNFGAPSLDLAWLSAGRIDGFWQRDLPPPEMAAGLIIATEAGAEMRGIDTREHPMQANSLFAACPGIFAHFKSPNTNG